MANAERDRIGLKLKRLREEAGLTLDEVADLTGDARQTVSRWEGGTSALPTDKIVLLASILNCPVVDIYDGNDPPLRNASLRKLARIARKLSPAALKALVANAIAHLPQEKPC